MASVKAELGRDAPVPQRGEGVLAGGAFGGGQLGDLLLRQGEGLSASFTGYVLGKADGSVRAGH
ncbi:hypothetical protein GCM10027162_39340 [Streptomyces incanus]